MAYKYKTDYDTSYIPQKYGDQGLMLYALALRYNIEDVDSLAITSLTDNFDDKCIDALHFVDDERTAIIIQGYNCHKNKQSAPASKAADFNTAFSWALGTEIGKVPSPIHTQVSDLRNEIMSGDVTNIEFWYVHNLDESEAVQEELDAALVTAEALIKRYFPGKKIFLCGLEVGNRRIENWYKNKTQTIMVDDKLQVDLPFGGYFIDSDDWAAFDTSVTLEWIHELFQKYQSDLFSANIRGYLGSSSNEINNGIKDSSQNDPKNFWVYNNGITCLVHSFKLDKDCPKVLEITGISIVNGAQTTGAIGSVSSVPGGYLPARFVMSKKHDLWQKIIQFNNSQNKIFSYDFKSNDEVQKRLRDEFLSIKDTEYTGRRGGALDITRKHPNLIGVEGAAIALVAFHGKPEVTYHKKAQIWNDENYKTYFNSSLTAKHLVFTYSLAVAIENKKQELKKDYLTLSGIKQAEYEFLKKRGGMRLYLAAIGASMEEILDQKIADTRVLSFGNISWKKAAEKWKEVIDLTIMNVDTLVPEAENGIAKEEFVRPSNEAIRAFKKAIAVQVAKDKTLFANFKNTVKFV